MEIIDSHQHFWEIGRFNYEWMSPDNKTLYQNYLPETAEALLKQNGVEKVVAVQAHQSTEETRWLLNLANQFPFIAGVVGWVDLLSDDLENQLNEFSQHPKFKGIRHLVQDELDDKWIIKPKVISGINKLVKYNLTFDILIFPRHLRHIPKLLESCPDVRFVIDHLAKPAIATGDIRKWKEDLKKVAAFPQIYCKLSGLVTEANHHQWKLSDLKPYAETALELFGPDRLLFGSDYPVCLLAANYKTVLDTYRLFLENLSDEDLNKVMKRNAYKCYRLVF